MTLRFDSRIIKPISDCGIYAIVNILNQRLYVGSAVQFCRRWAKHRSCLRGGRHPNPYLQNAFKANGESAFRFVVLEYCSPGRIIDRENYWINAMNAHVDKGGYNFLPAAGSRLGSRLTQEQKDKMRAKLLEVHAQRPDIGQRSGAARRGRKNSKEHIAKVISRHVMPYKLISPEGEIHEGTNRAEFCKQHGLSQAAICQLIAGKYRSSSGILTSYRGWRAFVTC